MINLIKIDFKRATSNKQFYIVIVIGLALVVIHYCFEIFQYIKLAKKIPTYYNPFVKWFINDGYSVPSMIYFMIFPLLASMPYSDSYWLDINSGFSKSVYTRASKTKYVLSRYITNFIIGGISVVIPLIFSFYLLLMTFPATRPNIFSSAGGYRDMFYSIYYFSPYLYVISYIILCFLFGGLCSTMALSISTYCKSRFMVLSIPTIVFISMIIFELASLPQLVPMKFLNAGQPVEGISIKSIILIFVVFMFLCLISAILGEKRDEVD